jgi:hypothetical protein
MKKERPERKCHKLGALGIGEILLLRPDRGIGSRSHLREVMSHCNGEAVESQVLAPTL